MMRHTALRTALALVIAACAGCSAGAPEPPAEALFNDPGLASHSALPQGAESVPASEVDHADIETGLLEPSLKPVNTPPEELIPPSTSADTSSSVWSNRKTS